MKSLVEYDESDSETEEVQSSNLASKDRPVENPSGLGTSYVEKSTFSLGKDIVDKHGQISAVDVPGNTTVPMDHTGERWLHYKSNFTPVNVKRTFGAHSASYAQKRPSTDSPWGETLVKPYIPKRLKQEKELSVESDGTGEPSALTPTATTDVSWNVFRASDYLRPYLPSKYRYSEIPDNVVFTMNEHTAPVNRVQWNPVCQYSHLLLSASMDTTIKPIQTYKAAVQQHFEILFLPNGKEFLSTTDSVSRDSADRTIIAWDFGTAAKISNQIFHERYTCPSLALHPKENVFIAQTNGNYIALFSTQRPYKMNKKKRFEGHKVEGFAVGCEFSPDGSLIVTGSSEGKVFFYNYHTSKLLRSKSVSDSPCVSVTFHPVLSSLVASAYWDGNIRVWQ
uniref:WD repeat domain 25 n=1 Tax=Leptobrachium leishanense TaxID=445787 RepID=A0A8C5QXD5_9ANUR